jgi:hypothetical protein
MKTLQVKIRDTFGRSSKWFGVATSLSLGSDDTYVSSRLLSKFSTFINLFEYFSVSSQQIFTKAVQFVVNLDTGP